MFRAYAIALALFCGVAVGGTAGPAQAGNYTVLYAFQGGSDGANPRANLITVGGTLYGTTFSGGGSANCAGGCGTVFALNPTTGAEQVVHAFQAGSDGANPQAGLINVGGTLYGTTAFGGGSTSCTVLGTGCGTVFALNPTTGAETVVYVFRGSGSDGAVPYASLLNLGGTLYGTTDGGGSLKCRGGCGAVFALNPTNGSEKIVHYFLVSNDGARPTGGLINVGGTLYGTTSYGGGTGCGGLGCGLVFALTP